MVCIVTWGRKGLVMDTVEIDGIATLYDAIGSGPPLLMYSPGGFDSSMANWRTLGNYRNLKLLEQLSDRYTCIAFDRRESGGSGGRLERIGWEDYVSQGLGLLDHLGIERAHLMGGCVGCSSVAGFAVSHPERVLSMVLFSPAGGPRYRINQHSRLYRHMAYAAEVGMAGIVGLAKGSDKNFSQDPRVGPWVSIIRRDPSFAAEFSQFDASRYQLIIGAMAKVMFDRDTVPGADAEDLMQLDIPALIVPGQDVSHAPSAARYLEECLPGAKYWDMPVAGQTEQTAAPRILEFLDSI